MRIDEIKMNEMKSYNWYKSCCLKSNLCTVSNWLTWCTHLFETSKNLLLLALNDLKFI